MKKMLIFLSSYLGMLVSQAQVNGKEEALKAMKTMTQKYMVAKGLDFEVSYRYADEKNPGVWLDSLTGQVSLSAGRYWYALDNTEAIGTPGYALMLFKEDKVMYLSKPSPIFQQFSPLALLDSFILNKQLLEATVLREKNQDRIVLQFAPGSIYRKIEYFVDHKTGMINRLVSTVQSKQLYGPDALSLVEDENAYALVEVLFSHYSTGNIDEKKFDPDRYFKKQGNDFVTVAPYEEYKVFLGSPDLGMIK